MSQHEPMTDIARPGPINEHERTCPDCQRVIAQQQVRYDAARSQAVPPSEGLRKADFEWLAWFARKSKGTVAEVTQRALDQYPALREALSPVPESTEGRTTDD